jgi:Dolichyl-phosphate-mannose-protein mannosyltransferase
VDRAAVFGTAGRGFESLRARQPHVLSRSERLLLRLSLAAALVLRAAAYFRYRFDSDEQQHLHVTWGWTAGKLQYRDLFDNHAPLFHMLTAPILAMFGERSDILLWMRAPMLLLFGIVVWATWDLGRRLYDDRVAAWAVALLILFPPFFLKSLEFRTDNLWNAFWMLALVAIVRGKRPFLPGFLLGCALATSPKTSVLVIAIVTAALMLRFFRKEPWQPRAAIEAALGFVIVPAIITIYFATAGALDELVYCVFTFNGRVALMREHLWIGRALFPFTFAAVAWGAWRTRETPRMRWLLLVVIGVFTVTVAGFWPLISPRDFLPMMPLAAILTAAALRPVVPLAVTVALFLCALFYYADRFENHTDWHVTMMDQTLRLTRPGERLLDIKGETIYRERPFYYALEIVTRSQMAKGILPDTIAADVVRTRTYAAQADGPLWPPASRAWLSDHFVNLGRLRAAGQWVKGDGTFSIGVPGEYVVLTSRGEAKGTLDGTPYTGARNLAAGAHRFEGEKDVCVVWAPAFRRGHSPFHLRDTDF